MYTCLLTGTINSSVYNNIGNKIQDTEIRLQQYENSIYRYICDSVFEKIVFIENSGFPFNSNKYYELAKKNKKLFEFISGSIMKEEIIQHGKSFGDAFLINEAIEKSQLLKDENIIYKITGRIFLLNSKKIIKTYNRHDNEFIIYNHNNYCLTNFFKFKKIDYLNYLSKAYQYCDEKTVNDIEYVFYRLINENKAKMDIGCFKTYPYFDGVMGATLRNYSGSKSERVLRNILSKFNAFNIDGRLSFLLLCLEKVKQRNR